MRSVAVAVALLVLAASPILSAKLPHYLKPCRRNDPRLNDCALKHTREAIPFVMQGDPKYGIPKLDPLVLDKIVVGDGKQSSSGVGLTFSCHQCRFVGLKGVQPSAFRVDPVKQHLELEGSIAQILVKGKYSAHGKILVLPIEGNGDAELILRDLSVVYKVDYDLKKGKDGRDHAKLKTPKIDFKANGFNIKLTNLFKGDKALSEQMNQFLNDNWRDVLTEFGPAVAQAVGKIVTLVVNNISDKVAYDDILTK